MEPFLDAAERAMKARIAAGRRVAFLRCPLRRFQAVQPGDVGLQTELPGRLEASRVAQVRARAAGILQQRLFKEGSDVKAGQALFRIDAAPYQATLQSAQASLARAQANLASTTAVAERYKPLVAENAISQQEYTNAVAAQKAAEADVAAARPLCKPRASISTMPA